MQVEQGQLRRFKPATRGARGGVRLAGQVIVILEVDYNHATAHGGSVKFLIDGRVEVGWSRLWVLENSEVLNEAR